MPAAPGVDEVHVWRIGLAVTDAVAAVHHRMLSAGERRRAAAFTDPAARLRFLVGHGASRHILAGYLAVPPPAVPWRVGRWGKPYLDAVPLRISLTHSGDLALLAVTGAREIGIDVEAGRGAVDAVRMADRYFTPDEARQVRTASAGDRLFRRLWVRKEACVKASGVRLLQGLRLPVAGTGPAVAVADPGAALGGPWQVVDLPLAPPHVAAAAVIGTEMYRVALLTYPRSVSHPNLPPR
jgi:4'-phosphopantetheinyl transferase